MTDRSISRSSIFDAASNKIAEHNSRVEVSLRNCLGESLFSKLNPYRFLAVRIFLVILYFIIGVCYYATVEDWSVIDCIFFITVSIATVGYGDFTPSNDNSRVFTAFFILFGLVVVLTAVDDFARKVAVQFQNVFINRFFSLDSKAERVVKKVVISSSCLVSLVILGTIVFEYNEDWSSADAFYFTIVTMTTVGYGDLVMQHISSRVFTIFLIWVCLILYATMIQNLREMYLLTLSLPTNSDDEEARLSARNIRAVGDGEIYGTQVEMGTVSTPSTYNPLDRTASDFKNSSLASPAELREPVDAVACLFAALGAGSENVALRADLAALLEKHKSSTSLNKTVVMSRKDLLHHVANFPTSADKKKVVPSRIAAAADAGILRVDSNKALIGSGEQTGDTALSGKPSSLPDSALLSST